MSGRTRLKVSSQNLVVNSMDRNRGVDQNAFDFRVDLRQSYRNVVRVDLIEAVVPKHLVKTDGHFVYIEIVELSGNFHSTNFKNEKCFARFSIMNDKTYIEFGLTSITSKTFDIPISYLSRLTLKFYDDNGDLVDPGKDLYPIDHQRAGNAVPIVDTLKVKLKTVNHMLLPQDMIKIKWDAGTEHTATVKSIGDNDTVYILYPTGAMPFTQGEDTLVTWNRIEQTFRNFILNNIVIRDKEQRLYRLVLANGVSASDPGFVSGDFVAAHFQFDMFERKMDLYIYDAEYDHTSKVLEIVVNLPFDPDSLENIKSRLLYIGLTRFGESARMLRSSFTFKIHMREKDNSFMVSSHLL